MTTQGPSGRAMLASSPTRLKIRPLPNIIWLTKMRSWPPVMAAVRNRSEKVSNGSAAIRSTSIQPASAQRANCRRALWNSPSVVRIRSGPESRAGAAVMSRMRKSCVLDEKTIAEGSPLPISRTTCSWDSGQTSPMTLSHLRSARRAASFQAATCPAKLASGHRWWLCAAKCSRPGSAPRLRENSSLKLKDRSSATTTPGRHAFRASSEDRKRPPTRRCRACCR